MRSFRLNTVMPTFAWSHYNAVATLDAHGAFAAGCTSAAGIEGDRSAG